VYDKLKHFAYYAALAATLAATPVTAQFVSSSESTETGVCPNRPPSPLIVENMDVRDAHRATLIQRMYSAGSLSSIVETGNCDCETRFPSWEPAVEYYLENYAMLENRHEIQSRTSHYRRVINDSRDQAREVCRGQGNW